MRLGTPENSFRQIGTSSADGGEEVRVVGDWTACLLRPDPDAGKKRNLYGVADAGEAVQKLEAWRTRVGLSSQQSRDEVDRLTEERLRSLGYIK